MHNDIRTARHFESPHDLRRATLHVQTQLIALLSPEAQALPKFRLVQLGAVPSQRKIAEALVDGLYGEFL